MKEDIREEVAEALERKGWAYMKREEGLDGVDLLFFEKLNLKVCVTLSEVEE